MQPAQRGIAGAEIVNRQAHAQPAQLGQCGVQGADHGDPLQHFNAHAGRFESVAREVGADALDKQRIAQAAFGQVEAQGQAPITCTRLKSSQVGAGLIHHETVNHFGQADLLGQFDERAGQHQTALRMLPAHQRLEARDAPVHQINHRLVIHPQFARLDRVAQIGFQPCALLASSRLVDNMAVAAARLLDPVHGHGGVAENFSATGITHRADGNAGAGRQVQIVVGQAQRRLQSVLDPLAKTLHILAIGGFQQHTKFVAADARDHVLRARHTTQPVRQFGQRLVARRITQVLVDDIKPVHADEHHGEIVILGFPRAAHRAIQQFQEHGAPRQSREHIAQAVGLPLLLNLLLIGDVAQQAHVRHLAPLTVVHRSHRQRQVAHRRVLGRGVQEFAFGFAAFHPHQ